VDRYGNAERLPQLQQQLLANGLHPEELSGDVPVIAVSATQRLHLDTLRDTLQLHAEMLELHAEDVRLGLGLGLGLGVRVRLGLELELGVRVRVSSTRRCSSCMLRTCAAPRWTHAAPRRATPHHAAPRRTPRRATPRDAAHTALQPRTHTARPAD